MQLLLLVSLWCQCDCGWVQLDTKNIKDLLANIRYMTTDEY